MRLFPKLMSYCVGIDENGLGPRLGPLIVTAILARTTAEGEKVAQSRPKGRLKERLGDSKALVAFGDSVLGEAWARAVAQRVGACASMDGSGAQASVDDLVHALALDPRDELRAPCPREHAAQCWGAEGETFHAAPKLLARIARDLDALARAGVEIVGARVAIVCTRRLNDAVLAGSSRFDSDLHAMERLVVRAREDAGEDVLATCGKVGGFDRYADRFGPLAGRLHVALEEGRARSTYRIPGVGTIGFVRDADATNLLVCMASLVGKWVRDTLMTRVVRYHRALDPDLPDASGYHDPVTTRFILASELSRKKRNLPDACFVRNRLERDGAGDADESRPARATSSARPTRKAPPARKTRPAPAKPPSPPATP